MQTRSKSRPATADPAKATGSAPPTKTIEKKKRAAPTKGKTASASKIKVGDTLPGGTLVDLEEKEFQVEDLYKEKGLVIFCVPKANTSGCNKQAQQFKDSYEELTKKGYEVLCISADSPKAQKSWKDKYELPYKFGSDKDRKVVNAWGVAGKGGTSTTRSHLVVEKGGEITTLSIGTTPAVSRDEVMTAIRTPPAAKDDAAEMEIDKPPAAENMEKKEGDKTAQADGVDKAANGAADAGSAVIKEAGKPASSLAEPQLEDAKPDDATKTGDAKPTEPASTETAGAKSAEPVNT